MSIRKLMMVLLGAGILAISGCMKDSPTDPARADAAEPRECWIINGQLVCEPR